MKKRLRNDLILIGALLLLGLAGLAVLRSGQQEGGWAVVRIQNREVGRYSLAVDGEYELNNGTNHLVIKDGEAYISHAECPDQICVYQGKISLTGQTITCLPNKLTVTVEGGTPGADLVS